jgi:hypothetical protein
LEDAEKNGFRARGYLAGSSRRRPSDFATSAIFLSPTTEKPGYAKAQKKKERYSSFVTSSYFQKSNIIIGVTEHGKPTAQHGEQDDACRPYVDGRSLVNNLQENLWSTKTFCAASIRTVANFLVLALSSHQMILLLFSKAEINQPENAIVDVEIVPAVRWKH